MTNPSDYLTPCCCCGKLTISTMTTERAKVICNKCIAPDDLTKWEREKRELGDDITKWNNFINY